MVRLLSFTLLLITTVILAFGAGFPPVSLAGGGWMWQERRQAGELLPEPKCLFHARP
jgi:hypothetical protein